MKISVRTFFNQNIFLYFFTFNIIYITVFFCNKIKFNQYRLSADKTPSSSRYAPKPLIDLAPKHQNGSSSNSSANADHSHTNSHLNSTDCAESDPQKNVAVIMVYHINSKKVNAKMLYNLFCLYADVNKVI